jgi:hypothetical protein
VTSQAVEPGAAGRALRRSRLSSTAFLAVLGALSVVVVGLSWSLASPIGASPDDDFHLATIWCDAGDPDTCRRTGDPVEDGIERVRVLPMLGPSVACYAFRADLSAGCQAKVEREVGLVDGRADNGLYPGGFHRAMSLLVSSRVGRSVLAMRMVSWLLAVALLVVVSLLATPDLRRAFTLAMLTTLVPLGVFLFASTNPSGLTTAAIAAYWCAACAYTGGTYLDRGRVGALVALLLVCVAVALASRYDAGFHLAVASAAAWITGGGYSVDSRRRSSLVLALGAAGSVFALSGTQSQRALGELADSDRALGAVLFENTLELPRLVLGALGTFGLGWLDTPLPALTSVLMLLAFGGAVVAGLGSCSRSKWLALTIVAGALVAVPAIMLALDRYLVGEHVQPRYLLPLLPVLVGTALATSRDMPAVELRRAQVAALGTAVVVAHAAALHANIRRYVTGVDVDGFDLGSEVEWWWGVGPGPLWTWLLGSLAFASATVCALLLTRLPATSGGQERTWAGAP